MQEMYRSEKFIEHANKFLSTNISESVIEEVKEIRQYDESLKATAAKTSSYSLQNEAARAALTESGFDVESALEALRAYDNNFRKEIDATRGIIAKEAGLVSLKDEICATKPCTTAYEEILAFTKGQSAKSIAELTEANFSNWNSAGEISAFEMQQTAIDKIQKEIDAVRRYAGDTVASKAGLVALASAAEVIAGYDKFDKK
ncbi:MAG: hypothetical protein CDV28_16610 [Candidatus Electronema aureum]|uniref:Uncharacterized protein n=1 Tax=Candidatus Electronema aureum TaxID=2005002 RepID=A0A521FY86_9BACT|nr:MAG: hypothetical protein CDV28_16610 [Candidatus Electronema aureum]